MSAKDILILLVAITCIVSLERFCLLVRRAEVEGVEEERLGLLLVEDPIGNDFGLRRDALARLRSNFYLQELGLVLLILMTLAANLRPVATGVLDCAHGAGQYSQVRLRALSIILVCHLLLQVQSLIARRHFGIRKSFQLVSLVFGSIEE